MDGQEIKLKLEVEPGQEGRLKRRLTSLTGRRGRKREISSTYYDTDDLAIHDAGGALRVSGEEGIFLQTVSLDGTNPTGLMENARLQHRLDGPEPDLNLLQGTRFAQLLRSRPRSGLVKPVFSELATCTDWNTQFGASRFLTRLDKGIIDTGTHQTSFNELEMELVEGSADDLFNFALRLDENMPLRLGAQSRADRGYRVLRDGATDIAPSYPALVRQTGLGEAFRLIARACIHDFLSAEILIEGDQSVEAVHQARIALRRLDTLFRLFRRFAPIETSVFRPRLKEVMKVLGEVRNLDVLFELLPEQQLRRQLLPLRAQAHGRLIAMLQSSPTRRLMLELSRAIETTPAIPANLDLPRAARKMLRSQRRRLLRAGGDFRTLTARQLHMIRIEAKRLRYAIEFFGPLFPDRCTRHNKRDRMNALVKLQKHLGTLNDIETTRTFLGTIKADAPSQQLRASAVLAFEALRQQRRKHMRAARKAFEKVIKTGPFWRKPQGRDG